MIDKKTDCPISDMIRENIQIDEEISRIGLEIKRVNEEISKIVIDIYGCENTLNDLIRYETRYGFDTMAIANEYKKISNRNALLEHKLNKLIKKRLLLVQKKKMLKQKFKMNKKYIQNYSKRNQSDNIILLQGESNGIGVKKKRLINIFKRNK